MTFEPSNPKDTPLALLKVTAVTLLEVVPALISVALVAFAEVSDLALNVPELYVVHLAGLV